MAIIDLVRWAPERGRTIYAWRFPETNLSTYTQLLVHESQEAILYSKGEFMAKFGPGKHTLNTENLPILRRLFGIPFGKKNPFTAEVWFVNKLEPVNIHWTTSSMPIRVVDFDFPIPLMAKGRYGLRMTNAEKFLLKLVGTKWELTEFDLTDQSAGEFSEQALAAIAQFLRYNHIGYLELSERIKDISQHLKNELLPFWEERGFELVQLNITSIDIDTQTELGRKATERISQDTAQYTYQQKRMLDVAEKAMENLSSGSGGLLGGLVAMNMMSAMGGSGMMQPQPAYGANSPAQQGQAIPSAPQTRDVYCSNCSKKYPNTHRFCPHCGDPYNPCPKCGTDNSSNAKRCISCGLQLLNAASSCPNCNAPLAAGSSFCGNCGKRTQSEDNCNRCGVALSPTAKFCPKCGNKR